MAEEVPCPCNVTPNAGKFGAIAAGMNSNIFKNPNAAEIAMAKTGFGANIDKVQGFAAMFPLGANPFSGLLSQLQASNELINQFEVTSNRLSGLGSVLGKPDILALVSSVTLAAKIQCAFGIPGLDIGAAIGAVTGPGKTSVLAAVAASVDIGSMLDNIGLGDIASMVSGGGDLGGISDLLAGSADALGAVNGGMGGLLAAGDQIYADAVGVIEKFSTLSATIDILNDPCNKLSVSLGQNIINPEFLAVAKQANPFAPSGGFPI